jgi:hypothetical protein
MNAIVVKLKQPYGCNNAGEICGFTPDVADMLIKKGAAEFIRDLAQPEAPAKKTAPPPEPPPPPPPVDDLGLPLESPDAGEGSSAGSPGPGPATVDLSDASGGPGKKKK